MGMTSMIPAIVTIVCLCSSGLGASGIGVRNSKTTTASMQLCCCCVVILLVAIGGTYLVGTAP